MNDADFYCSPSMDAEKAQAVQLRLISWLVKHSLSGESKAVFRKLCSVLTTYFIQSPLTWERPLLHLALCFRHGDSFSAEDINYATMSMSTVLPALDAAQLRGLLEFAGSIAEGSRKLSKSSSVHANTHASMERAVDDAVQLVRWGLDSHFPSEIKADALQVYSDWVDYVEPVWPKNTEDVQQLRSLLGEASQCLLDDEISRDALQIFRDMLESYSTFFRPQHMELLFRVTSEHLRHQIADADDDSVRVVTFIVALGCGNIQQIVEGPSEEFGSRTVIDTLMDVVQMEGIPGDADMLSYHTIEFWNCYIEYVIDILASDDLNNAHPPWLDHARLVLSRIVELLYRKLWIPPASTAEQWTDEEQKNFTEFRQDCTDLMNSICDLLGKSMLQQLVGFALQSLGTKAWRGVEAALKCLNTVCDTVVEDSENEEVIAALFRSDLFVQMANFEQPISTQTRKTAIEMLASYGQYISDHQEFLHHTVRFLFAALESPSLANGASMSIGTICSACRTDLTGLLPDFLVQYQKFLDSPGNNNFTKLKIIGGIASIIQAMRPESVKAEPLLVLISNIEKDIEDTKQYAAGGDMEMAELVGVTALECLAAVGKGMQEVDEVTTLDDDDDQSNMQNGSGNFWTSESGQNVQSHIMNCFSVLQVIGMYSGAVDAACQVLRSGFAETHPGPFVFPPSVTVEFLQQCNINTAQLEAVLATASMLITTSSRQHSKLTDDAARTIFQITGGFTETLQQASNDPGVASGCIELWTRMMPAYTHVLFMHITPNILDFTLSSIEAPETFPKKAACEFWKVVIQPQSKRIPPETQQSIDNVMMHYGPKLVMCLTRQIGGHAQRSDLDILCGPLVVMLVRQPQIKTWLTQGLGDSSFPGTNMSMKNREIFLKTLMTVRSDGKRVKDTVREFWAACRGTVMSYSSS